jgi:hypothetical protein
MSFTFESFSEETEEKVLSLLSEAYDFTRCQRADGSFYGTSGQCRKGTTASAKEESAPGRKERINAALRAKAKESRVRVDAALKKEGKPTIGEEMERAAPAKGATRKKAYVSSSTASAVKEAIKKNPVFKGVLDRIKSAEKRKREIDAEIKQIRSALSRKNAADVPGKEKRIRELDREWGKADLEEAKGRKILNQKVREGMAVSRLNAPKPKNQKEADAATKVSNRRVKAQKDSENLEAWKREFGALMRGANRGDKTAKSGRSLMEIAAKRADRVGR